MSGWPPRVAVVGHVEWVVHVRGAMPAAGEITYLADPLEEPAGGGAVTASQVAKLGARCTFLTALGDDDRGRASRSRLEAEGVEVLAVTRPGPQTWALSASGPDGERGIAVVGPPVVASAADPLPWDCLAACDAVYFTGHDAGALRLARAAGVLVVTARRLALLVESGIQADVVVASASDENERVDPGALPLAPGALVLTEGGDGGRILIEGVEHRYPPARPPGPVVDAYGAGDSFAAGLTVGLGMGLDLDGACALGARCGAAAVTARGGLDGQLRDRVAAR